MALFGTPQAFVGLDIGTSSLKLVELLNRRKRIELVTYAQANISNLLVDPVGNEEDAIRQLASVISRMFETANVSTDVVVAALPNSVVFSTVLTLPDISDQDMDNAVHFAARDIVPDNLEDLVLGWSRVGHPPHMDSDEKHEAPAPPVAAPKTGTPSSSAAPTVPVFVTAAPKAIVERYTKLIDLLHLNLFALEVETFALVRSLMSTTDSTAMIVDIGNAVTTMHVIDKGAARVSHSVDYGGQHLTEALLSATGASLEKSEELKVRHGLLASGPSEVRAALQQATEKLLQQGQQIEQLYKTKTGRAVSKTILIGGGASLKGLAEKWTQAVGHAVTIGNPWKGLTVPNSLEPRLQELGPTYAVAVGLAQRGLSEI